MVIIPNVDWCVGSVSQNNRSKQNSAVQQQLCGRAHWWEVRGKRALPNNVGYDVNEINGMKDGGKR